MKYILITDSFYKILKKYEKHFKEQDILFNLKKFIRIGFKKGESRLKIIVSENIKIEIIKLRLRVNRSIGRYLVAIIDEYEYIPFFIDLKTGYYGKNLSFKTNKRVVSTIETALENAITDYLENSAKNPKLKKYSQVIIT